MENNILSAKLDSLISLQVTLAPFCSKIKKGNKTVSKANILEKAKYLLTCVNVSVFAPILRGNDRTQICSR